MQMKQKAAANFAALTRNPYPGRIIIEGLDETGQNLTQLYVIMGRSGNSRNRVFSCDDAEGRLFTEAADPAKMKDPSLVIYNAMREVHHAGASFYVLSNGSQTDNVADGYNEDRSMHTSLENITYEPDAPNFTQRITASCYWHHGTPIAEMSILRRSPFGGDECEDHFHRFKRLYPGFGHCITTYNGDGDPLPAFRGEPYEMPLLGDAEWIAALYWGALDPENRVSLAVKSIPLHEHSSIIIANKYTKIR